MLFTIHNLPAEYTYHNIKHFIRRVTNIPRSLYKVDLHVVYNKDRRDYTKMVSVRTTNESVGELIIKTLDGMYLKGLKLVVTTEPPRDGCESSILTIREEVDEVDEGTNNDVSQRNDWSVICSRERNSSTDSRRRDSPKSVSDLYRFSGDGYRASSSPSLYVSPWETNRESRHDYFTRNKTDDSFKGASRSPNRRESGIRHDSSFQNEIEPSDNMKQFRNAALILDQRYNEASSFSSYSEKDNSVAPPSRWDQKEWPRTVSQSNPKSENSASDMLFVEKFVQAHANVIASQSTEAQKVDILKASKTLETFSPFIYYNTSDHYKKIFDRIISFKSIYGKHVTDCNEGKIKFESNKTTIVDSNDFNEPPEKKSVGEAYYNKDKGISESVPVPHYYYVSPVMVTDPVTGSQGICQMPMADSSQNQNSGLFYYGHNQAMPTQSLVNHDGFYAMMTNNPMMQQATLPYYYDAGQTILANQNVNVSNDQSEDLDSNDEDLFQNYDPIEKDREARTEAADYLTSELVNKFRIGDLPGWKKNQMELKINANIRREFHMMFGENSQTNSRDIIAKYDLRHDIHDNAELINAIHLNKLHPETRAGSSYKLVPELTPQEKKAIDDEIESLIGAATDAFLDPSNEVEKALGEAAVDRGILEYLKEAIKENVVARIMNIKFKLQVKLDFEKKQKPKNLYLNEFLNNFGLVSLKHVSPSCVAEINCFRHLDKLCSINATKIGGVNTTIRPVLYGGSPIKLSRKIAIMRRKHFFKGPLLKKYNSIARNDEKLKIEETASKNNEARSDTGIKVKNKTASSTANSTASNDSDNDVVEIIENIETVELYSGDEMCVKDMEIEDSDQEQECSSDRTSDQTITYGGSMESIKNEKESMFGDQITNVEGVKAVINTRNVTSICQESDAKENQNNENRNQIVDQSVENQISDIGANECHTNENTNQIVEQSVEDQISDNVATVENVKTEKTKIAEIETSGQLFDSEGTENTNQTIVNVESTKNTDHENDLRREFDHNTDITDGNNDGKIGNGDIPIISGDNENNVSQEIPVKCDSVDTTDAEKLEDNNTLTNRVIENENSLNSEKKDVECELMNSSNNSGLTKDPDPISTDNNTIAERDFGVDKIEVTERSDETSVNECQDVEKSYICQDTDNEVIGQSQVVKNDVKCQDAGSVECDDIENVVENSDIECQNESLSTNTDEVSFDCDDENANCDQTPGENDEEVSLMKTILSSNDGENDETEDLDELDPNYVKEWGDMWSNVEDDNLEDY